MLFINFVWLQFRNFSFDKKEKETLRLIAIGIGEAEPHGRALGDGKQLRFISVRRQEQYLAFFYSFFYCAIARLAQIVMWIE